MMAKRLGNMLAPIGLRGRGRSRDGSSRNGSSRNLEIGDTEDTESDRDDHRFRQAMNTSDNTSMSVVSDNATLYSNGGVSVALTINSNDTVKASNRQTKNGGFEAAEAEGDDDRFKLKTRLLSPLQTPEKSTDPVDAPDSPTSRGLDRSGNSNAIDKNPNTNTSSGSSSNSNSAKKWHKKLKRLVASVSAKPIMNSSVSVGVGHRSKSPWAKSAYDIMSTDGGGGGVGYPSRLRPRVGSVDAAADVPNRRGLRARSSGSLDRTDNEESTIESKPNRTSLGPRYHSSSARRTSHLDAAIRGRLDGMDILALAPVRRRSLPIQMAADVYEVLTFQNSRASEPESDNGSSGHRRRTSGDQIELQRKAVPLPPSRKEMDSSNMTFTGVSVRRTTAQLVLDMIWTSAGKEPPEIILEGFVPGGADRWSVRMENLMEKVKPISKSPPSAPDCLSESAPVTPDKFFGCGGHLAYWRLHDTYDMSVSTPPRLQEPEPIVDDGSPGLPTHQLWDKIWGDQEPPPIPTHMLAVPPVPVSDSDVGDDNSSNAYSDDRILQMAAELSVPIDLDEDTFIIDNAVHLRSVHDIVMVPLQQRNLGSSLTIFRKLLQSLEIQSKSNLEHLLACTHHNIGILHLCQSEFAQGLDRFHNAVQIRRNCLPMNHPDVAVSLQRQGIAHFALDNIDQAIRSFMGALTIVVEESASRAKLLNNLGVAQVHNGNNAEALKLFTSALEIQRQWLDGPVRRESIVYDASITLGNMGKVYLEQSDYDLAYYVFEEACLLLTTTFRKDHDIVLSSLENLALSKLMNEQHKKAMQIYSSILRLQISRFGPESQQAIETTGTMAYLHVKERNMDDALSCLQLVQKWQNNNLSQFHPAAQMTDNSIKTIEEYIRRRASQWI